MNDIQMRAHTPDSAHGAVEAMCWRGQRYDEGQLAYCRGRRRAGCGERVAAGLRERAQCSAAAAAACGKVRVFRQRVAAPTGLLRERIQKAYGAFEAELKAEWLQTDRSNFIYSRYH